MNAKRNHIIALGLLLVVTTAIATSSVASSTDADLVKWFEAHFSGSRVTGYVIGVIDDGTASGCAVLEDHGAGRLDAGCGSVNVFVDPALRSAHISGEIGSQVFDLRRGRVIGASSIVISVSAVAVGLPAVGAAHRAGMNVPQLGQVTGLMNGAGALIAMEAAAHLIRPAGGYGSLSSTRTCLSPTLRRSSRPVRLPVPCVRGIRDSGSDSATLGQVLSASIS